MNQLEYQRWGFDSIICFCRQEPIPYRDVAVHSQSSWLVGEVGLGRHHGFIDQYLEGIFSPLSRSVQIAWGYALRNKD